MLSFWSLWSIFINNFEVKEIQIYLYDHLYQDSELRTQQSLQSYDQISGSLRIPGTLKHAVYLVCLSLIQKFRDHKCVSVSILLRNFSDVYLPSINIGHQ